MTQSEFIRVRDLFERALAEQPQDVSVWLDREADGDALVRAEVASLLDHLSHAETFLANPPSIVADVSENPPFAPGHVIGQYTIIRYVGGGGFGRVYVATDARLGRAVALKAVRVPTDSAQREYLKREAIAVAALRHEGICTVYALEELDGHLLLASQFIEGRTLRQEMASGDRRSANEILETARAVAAALMTAHEAGVTHGDLKPENIMRTYDGQLKIVDFGLARIEPRSSSALPPTTETAPGLIPGTPAYMAPEQLNGRPRNPRTDVWAFGVLMYEYACGAHPFAASTASAMQDLILESEPRPVEAYRPDLAPWLVAVIRRCLRKASAERFGSASEISTSLSGKAAGAPGGVATWWRAHQLIIVGVYGLASAVAWHVKESLDDTTRIFFAVAIAATVGAVFRGHLLFTESVNRANLGAELRRTGPVTMPVDLFIALALGVDGALMASGGSQLAAILTIALGVCLALARVILEPSTTSGAFGTPD